MRWAPAIAAWSMTVVAPGTARAENPEALRLFAEGRVLADQGKLAEACELFAKSYQLERAAGTTLNLADCAEREGQLRRAWLLYDAAASEFDKTQKPGRARFARDRADAVAAKLATVVLRLAEPGVAGLTVRIGDHAARPAAEIVERIDPGQVSIVVSAPGREPFSATRDAAGGSQVVLEVPALPVAGASAQAPRPERATRGGRRRGRVLLAAGFAGTGVLALGTSGALAWTAKRLHDEQFRSLRCVDQPSPEPSVCLPEGLTAIERAGQRADIATAVAIGGGALLVAGAILYYTAPRERVTVAPVAAPDALGLALGGRF